MSKSKLKAGIKVMMKRYNFTLEQAIWSARKLNPDYNMLISEAELELIEDQLMGRLS